MQKAKSIGIAVFGRYDFFYAIYKKVSTRKAFLYESPNVLKVVVVEMTLMPIN